MSRESNHFVNQAGKRVALVIGISHYQQLSDKQQLKWCADSAKDVYDLLISPEHGVCDPETSTLLTDKNLTDKSSSTLLSSDALTRQIEQIVQQLNPGDQFIFFFSGHGVAHNDDLYLYLPDSNSNQRGSLLRFTDLIKRLEEYNKLNKTIIIIDSCQSGIIFDAISNLSKNKVGLMSACQRHQFAHEYPTKKRTLFSHYFWQGIKNGLLSTEQYVSIPALQQYINTQIAENHENTQESQITLIQGKDPLWISLNPSYTHATTAKPKKMDDFPVPFTNQSLLISEVLKDTSPAYHLIDAPTGYGKTYLLQELNRLFLHKGWTPVQLSMKEHTEVFDLICSIFKKFGANNPNSNKLQEQANELALFWREQQKNTNQPTSNFAILIDVDTVLDTEKLNKQLIYFLIRFCKKIEDHAKLARIPFGRQNYRVILTGCRLSSLVSSDNFYRSDLRLFKYDSVHDATTRSFKFNNEDASSLSAHIMYFSEGHPHTMVELFKMYNNFADLNDFLLNDTKIQAISNQNIEDVRNDIPEKFMTIMDYLSPVRNYNIDLISILITKEILPKALVEETLDISAKQKSTETALDLMDNLTTQYLISRNDGFLKNTVTRRLLAKRLRNQSPEKFLDICKVAFDFYNQRLQSNDGRIDVIAIEWLYQKLQLLSVESASTNLENRKQISVTFFEDVVTCLNIIKCNNEECKAIELLDNLLDKLNSDVEFQFHLNYFLTYDSYNSGSFKKLSELIKDTRKSFNRSR